MFSPADGEAYHRGEIAVDSAGRIWVQAWLRSGPACTSWNCARCRAPDGDNYGNTLTMAVSADGGASFQRQPDLATTACRAGGRLSSLGTRLLMLWNDYSDNQDGSLVGTQFVVRNDSDALSNWAPASQAFTDQAFDGIYHGAALSAVADGSGGLHLVYKNQGYQQLYYRSFDGTAFSPRQLIDASTDDWILQPAITAFNNDLYVFENHLVGSEVSPRPPGFDPNNYQIRLFRKSAGWGTYQVVDDGYGIKGYPGSPESLSASASRVPCLFGQNATASSASDERIAFSPSVTVPRVATLRDAFAGPALDPAVWTSSLTEGTAGAAAGIPTLTPKALTGAADLFVTSVAKYGLTGSSLLAQVPGVVDSRGSINNKLVLTDGVNELGFCTRRVP